MMEATVIATRRTLVALGAAPDPERKTHKIVNLKYRLVGASSAHFLLKSSHVMEFWILRSGFRIPGTGFQFLSVEPGLVSAIPNFLSCIPDSKAQYS